MSLLAEAPLTKQSGPPSGVRALSWSLGISVVLVVGCGALEPPEPTEATVTVLAQGGPLHGTNGVYFGPDGRLYVASVSSATVAALDPESGTILERWGPEVPCNLAPPLARTRSTPPSARAAWARSTRLPTPGWSAPSRKTTER